MSHKFSQVRFSDEEIRRKALQIKIRALRIFSKNLNGNFCSFFQGHGMEFDQVREYQDGDERRRIDWNVTARIGHPFVKKFIEERDNSIMVAVDISGSQIFGSQDTLKIERATEITAVISILAQKNRDRLGLYLFSDEFESFRPPQKKKLNWQQTLYEILNSACVGKSENFLHSLDRLFSLLKKKSLLFLISDFRSEENYEAHLSVFSRKHQLICVIPCDPLEFEMKNVGLIHIKDAETGETVLVDTGDRRWRQDYLNRNHHRREKLIRTLEKYKIDYFFLTSENDYLKEFLRIFGKKKSFR